MSAFREVLAPVYDWFTEGFDTLDLKETKALPDQLRERARASMDFLQPSVGGAPLRRLLDAGEEPFCVLLHSANVFQPSPA